MRRPGPSPLHAVAVLLGAVLPLVPTAAAHAGTQVFVQAGSPMRYRDNRTNPGVLNWPGAAFNDSAWPAGVYGVGYETPAGSNPLLATNVPATTLSIYTRATFSLADPAQITSLFLGADYDDGYVAWINGVEVYRSPEMPAGTPAWNSVAASHESSNGPQPEYAPLRDVSAAGIPALRAGTNVLAVGVWNNAASSSDLVLVPYLVGNPPVQVTRGPYLQRGGEDGAVVRWRTSAPTDSVVTYAPPGGGAQTVSDSAATTEHVVALSGLAPSTDYTYTIGASTGVLEGGDAAHVLRTAPLPGTRAPLRFWVIGDSGTANASAAAVRDAWLAFAAGRPADAWLMLGDNAYQSGTNAEYEAAIFDMYPSILRDTFLWPTFGNHDGLSSVSVPVPAGPYYDMLTLPAAGEAGGVPSGTESYYSFDRGNVHFVCLNSYDEDHSPDGPMLAWLDEDLEATNATWVIAYWHHPPYTKGSHDSDSLTDSNGLMVEMRQWVLPVLESHGVDLVLTGHSHSYERSYLIDGHYGFSSTFNATMKKNGGDGRFGGSGPYQKTAAGRGVHDGTVYVVAGTSGQTGGGALNHPAMIVSLNVLGSLVLDVDGDRLDATFLDATATARDTFSIVKNTGVRPGAGFEAAPRAGVAPLAVQFEDRSTTNTAAWAWDFNADGQVDSVTPSPKAVYTEPGTYSVRLTVSNQSGSGVETRAGSICVAAQAPGPFGGVTLAASGGTLSWIAAPGAISYDVVKGSLGTLLTTHGDFGAALLGCLANDTAGTSAADAALPPVGDGFYYLVRSTGACGLAGSYDEGGAQAAPRDAAIASAAFACP